LRRQAETPGQEVQQDRRGGRQRGLRHEQRREAEIRQGVDAGDEGRVERRAKDIRLERRRNAARVDAVLDQVAGQPVPIVRVAGGECALRVGQGQRQRNGVQAERDCKYEQVGSRVVSLGQEEMRNS
jgi:hypothetical protein